MTIKEMGKEVQEFEKRAFRYTAQDGIMEMLFGVLFFVIAGVMQAKPHLTWLAALSVFPMQFLLKQMKSKFTYPRIGYVKTQDEDSKEFSRGFLSFLVMVFAIYVAAMLFWGDYHKWDAWMKWMPALVGGFCSGGMIYISGKTGLWRHRFLVVFCVGWGFACSIIPAVNVYHAISHWCFGLSFVGLCIGIPVFFYFLKTNPVRNNEVIDEK